ncbi:MAG: hypothetical protein FJW30_05910 [Acidobacteria bacterium]|nr:hypothetical protein [Acidobacteriota bacterium]
MFPAAAGEWVRVLGDGYEIATDAAPAVARRIAVRLEGMRDLLGGVKKPVPLRVLLIQDRTLYTSLRPGSGAPGFFQGVGAEDWVVVAWGSGESERVVSHELVHAFLEHSGPRRPLWLEEGLAEFYSTARLHDGYWLIGETIGTHEALLRRETWMGEELFALEPTDGHSRQGLFYAQSWAVVHHLLTARGVQPNAPRFFALLADGVNLAAACRDALGFSLNDLLGRARRMQWTSLRIGTDLTEASAPAAEKMTAADTEEMQVAVALASGQLALARKLAKSPAQRGLLALADGDKAEAIRLLRAAEPAPRVIYELAMLTDDEKLLQEVVRLNPNHFDAHHTLGVRASVRGESARAIEHLQAAAAGKPRSTPILHSLALELERAGRLEEARRAARQCLLAARNPVERQMAAGLDRLTRARPPAVAAKKPAVTVPPGWAELKGDTAAEGELVRFDCESSPPAAHVRTEAGGIVLHVHQPGRIRITGGGHTFACGVQQLRVRMEYIAATKELTAVEFR